MIESLNHMIGPRQTQTLDERGRWVRAVPLSWYYRCKFNPVGAWAVLWGRAHPVRWPVAGELEKALER